MSGDDLTIRLFFLGCAVAFGIAAVSVETSFKRTSFGVLTVACVAAAILWIHVKTTWPSVSSPVAQVATSPQSWFLVVMFLLAVFASQPSRSKTGSAPDNLQEGLPASDLTVTEKPQAAAKKPEKREFLQVTVEYLINFRRDEKYTHVQSERMIEPYIGKWMRVEGTIHEIYKGSVYLRFKFINQPQIQPSLYIDFYKVVVRFKLNWSERFHALGKGQAVTVIGRLDDIQADQICLEEGELC
jgi:hypothetical protein